MISTSLYKTSSNFSSHAGTPKPDTQHAFVREVERVGRDPIHWVRREASFALGALAKVVPDELIIDSLVSTRHSNLPNSYRWSL
jgi:hypothetical protein